MTTKVGVALGSTLVGLEPGMVTVRAEVTPRAAGVARFEIRGLSDEATREARVRVRSAFVVGGVLADALDDRHVVVTVQDLPPGTDTAPLDLAIAAAVLRAVGRPLEVTEAVVFAGELSLSGDVRAIRGVLPRLIPSGSFVLPDANAAEAGLSRVDCDVWTVGKLIDLLGPLDRVVAPTVPIAHRPHGREDLRGAQREVFDACRDEPRVLLVGPPGSGKTMLARRLASELAPLEGHALEEVLAIYSAAGLLDGRNASTAPPFRAPHHTVSTAGLLGGVGPRYRVGEVSLAHRGVLFLDELPEFRRGLIAELACTLREGRLEPGSRFASPARIVAAANPCPCGWYGDGQRSCRCLPGERRGYEERLAGLAGMLGLKRFDVPAVDLSTLAQGGR